MTTGKTIALTKRTFVAKVMSLLLKKTNALQNLGRSYSVITTMGSKKKGGVKLQSVSPLVRIKLLIFLLHY